MTRLDTLISSLWMVVILGSEKRMRFTYVDGLLHLFQ